MDNEVYYIPHDAFIFTNRKNLNQFNAEKILPAYDTYIKNGERLKEPWEIEIHLSGICQFSCNKCAYSTRHTGEKKSLEQIESIFSSLTERTHFVFFSGGGDPFAWTSWKELLNLREQYIPQIPIGVSTNLFRLPDIDLDMIDLYQIHVFGYDRKSYIEQIGFDGFDEFKENLLEVCKRNSKITLKVLLDTFVIEHLNKFLDFFIKYDVENIILKIPQNFLKNEVVSHDDYSEIYNEIISHPISNKFEIIIDNTKDLLFNSDIAIDKCYIAESGLYCLVREDGSVFPCVASPNNNTNSMGNINETSLTEIFNKNFTYELYNQNMLCGKCPLKACRHYRFNKVIRKKYSNFEQYLNCYIPVML